MTTFLDYKNRTIKAKETFLDSEGDTLEAIITLQNDSKNHRVLSIDFNMQLIRFCTDQFLSDVEKVDWANGAVQGGFYETVQEAMQCDKAPSSFEEVIKWIAMQLLKLKDEPCDVDHVTKITKDTDE